MTTGKKFRRAQQLDGCVYHPAMMPSDSAIFLLGLQPPTSGSCGIISEVHNWVFRHCKLSFSTWAGSTHTLKMMLMPRSQSLIVLVRFSELSAGVGGHGFGTPTRVVTHQAESSPSWFLVFQFPAMWDNQSTIPHPPVITLSVVWLLATRHGFTPPHESHHIIH